MTYEERLQQLREEWKTALHPRREIILRQARALEIAIQKREEEAKKKRK